MAGIAHEHGEPGPGTPVVGLPWASATPASAAGTSRRAGGAEAQLPSPVPPLRLNEESTESGPMSIGEKRLRRDEHAILDAPREEKKRATSIYTFRVVGCKNGLVHILTACGDTTLWDLLHKAFESFLEVEFGGGISAHLWCLTLQHADGGRESRRFSSEDEPELVDGDEELWRDEEPALERCTRLKELTLQRADQLRLDYDVHAYCQSEIYFVVNQVSPAAGSFRGPHYQGSEKVPMDSAPIVSAEEVAENAAFRSKYDAYMEGENQWSWSQGRYIRPEAPRWSFLETTAITSLIEAEISFTRAWKEVLEPCLLLRSKASTSGVWYKTKKMIGHRG